MVSITSWIHQPDLLGTTDSPEDWGMHESKLTPSPWEKKKKKITVSLSVLGLCLIVLPPFHGAFMQAGANYPKQEKKKAMQVPGTWEQCSHF